MTNDPIIIVKRSELILMFRRLAIEIEENPDGYKWAGDWTLDSITEFYNGENKRRDLENRDYDTFRRRDTETEEPN